MHCMALTRALIMAAGGGPVEELMAEEFLTYLKYSVSGQVAPTAHANVSLDSCQPLSKVSTWTQRSALLDSPRKFEAWLSSLVELSRCAGISRLSVPARSDLSNLLNREQETQRLLSEPGGC